MLATVERSAHLIAAYLDHALSDPRVTQAEAHVMAQLHREGPTPIGDLQREFGHKRSTLTGVIDRLERRGSVRREINSADRRSFVIHLTSSGRTAARHVTKVLDRLEEQVRVEVSSADLAGLEAVAGALAAAVERITA